MIQRREAVFLADRLHVGQLIAIERELIDVAPIERDEYIGKHGATVPSARMYVLPGTAVPFCKLSSPSDPWIQSLV